MPESIVQIKSLPGIKRDGTRFEGDNYVDGQWVRFQRGLPRKIPGYRSISKFLLGKAHALSAYTQDLLTYVHAGSSALVERFYIDNSNNTSVITDRTPLSLTASASNLWQFDVETATDVLGNFTPKIVAQVAPNLDSIANSSGGQLFIGDLLGTDRLVPITALPTGYSATGGVVALHPYTVFFGDNGYLAWSKPGDPSDFTGTGSGAANIASQKLVKGFALRGGPGNSPSGLFWSADALLRMSFVGGDTIFQFDTISTQTSILSAASVIEYDGIFYWIGTDRFLMFNGVVREIDNTLNTNFFFDNLNYNQRQKVFATKVPRFGEIWWCFPKGSSEEPNHAIILNVRENTWYDCALPNDGRGAGLFPAVFRRPLMTGVEPTFLPYSAREAENDEVRVSESGDTRVTESSDQAQYKLWVHEIGTDEVDGQNIQPIQSYFETADISLPVSAQQNKALQVLMLEPDFVQSGDLMVAVHGRANARAPEVNDPPKIISETPAIPQDQVVYFKTQRRELRFRFESNCIGGDYQMGLCLAHLQPGDGTVIG